MAHNLCSVDLKILNRLCAYLWDWCEHVGITFETETFIARNTLRFEPNIWGQVQCESYMKGGQWERTKKWLITCSVDLQIQNRLRAYPWDLCEHISSTTEIVQYLLQELQHLLQELQHFEPNIYFNASQT